MPDRTTIYTEARRWVGTPYQHHGRRIGQACDCIGLILGVGRAVGVPLPKDRELPAYGPLPHGSMCESMSDRYLERQSVKLISAAKPGQIGLFFVNARNVGQHFCIFGWHESTQRKTMIHAFMRGRHVIETGIPDFWAKRLLRVYDFRGVGNG